MWPPTQTDPHGTRGIDLACRGGSSAHGAARSRAGRDTTLGYYVFIRAYEEQPNPHYFPHTEKVYDIIEQGQDGRANRVFEFDGSGVHNIAVSRTNLFED